MAARKRLDEAARAAVLEAALARAAEQGFDDALLVRAGSDAGVGAEALAQLFPQGAASLVEFYSLQSDAGMERLLAKQDLAALKVRERIARAVLTRLEVLKPHKEAARRAAAFLLLPANAALGARLLYRSVDAMWHAAGDTATDFNFYTKRAILAGVHAATMVRWLNDESADESATRAFLDARIENVMQFEKLKAELKQRAKDLPTFADIVSGGRKS